MCHWLVNAVEKHTTMLVTWTLYYPAGVYSGRYTDLYNIQWSIMCQVVKHYITHYFIRMCLRGYYSMIYGTVICLVASFLSSSHAYTLFLCALCSTFLRKKVFTVFRLVFCSFLHWQDLACGSCNWNIKCVSLLWTNNDSAIANSCTGSTAA